MPLNHFALIAGLYHQLEIDVSESLLNLHNLPATGRLLDVGDKTLRISCGLRWIANLHDGHAAS